MASSGRKSMFDANARYQRASCRMTQSSRRPDIITGQAEMHGVASERVKAGIGVPVGNGERTIDAQLLVAQQPASRSIAEFEWHVSNRTRGSCEISAKIAGDVPGEAPRIEEDRRRLAAELKR